MRTCLRAVLLTALALAATVASAHAQAPRLIPGTHVRIRGVLEGILTRQAQDTLYVLTNEGANVAIPSGQVEVMEISTRLDRAAGAARGALIGTAAGAALGLLVWLGGFEEDSGEKATSGDAVLFTAAGLVGGVAYGAAQGRRVWQTLTLAPRVSLQPQASGRFAVAVRLPL